MIDILFTAPKVNTSCYTHDRPSVHNPRNIIYYMHVTAVVKNNKDMMKITVHGKLTFISRFKENNFAKSRFAITATVQITICKEKISHFTFHGKKKGRSRVTKIPFSTLIVVTQCVFPFLSVV